MKLFPKLIIILTIGACIQALMAPEPIPDNGIEAPVCDNTKHPIAFEWHENRYIYAEDSLVRTTDDVWVKPSEAKRPEEPPKIKIPEKGFDIPNL